MPSPLLLDRGQILRIDGELGTHWHYVPTVLPPAPDIVVVVHGTPGNETSAADTARFYLDGWLDAAEEHQAILIAPAFDQTNFGSKESDPVMGGYRGLFGRHTGADQFVLDIVDRYRAALGLEDSRFYLYGHSAGGQFVARFIVKHPRRVKGAVISAAATYPQPDQAIAWPYGLGRFEGPTKWIDPPAEVTAPFEPDPQDWLAACALPLTVVVGLDDVAWQPDRTGQKGNNRVVIARNWVQDMVAFAEDGGVDSPWRLSIVPGLGHGSVGLAPHCQAALWGSD